MSTQDIKTKRFIEKAINIHGCKYDYSKTIYINPTTDIIIICKNHGEYKQKPRSHLAKRGCKECSKNKKKNNIVTADDFINKAYEIHGDRYDYTNCNFINLSTKICIKCKIHGNFMQMPLEHFRSNCPKCSKNSLKTTEKFVAEAIKVHGNEYDYSLVDYVGRKTKVTIICKIHGQFQQSPGVHLGGSKCPKCSIVTKSNKNRKTMQSFIEKANIIHKNTYNYSNVNYIDRNTPVIIICNLHGEYLQSPAGHLSGNECQMCAIIKKNNKLRSNTTEFIRKAKLIHGEKFNYSRVNYKNNMEPVVIICEKHGEFMQRPCWHLSGRGCAKCVMCTGCELWRITKGSLCCYCKPKNENKLYKKTKEMQVVKFLKAELPNHEFIHNKSVGNECTNGHLFPDIRFDCNFYHLIIEVDEHKHRGANYNCDEQRMRDIIAKLFLPCIFIRYNPDSKDSNLNILLEQVKSYLEIQINEKQAYEWDDHGFLVKYLFY